MTFLAMGHTPDPDPSTVRCRKCGTTLVPFGQEAWRHALPACGAWMPRAREHCARRAGHGNAHATRYAMDCDAESRRVA